MSKSRINYSSLANLARTGYSAWQMAAAFNRKRGRNAYRRSTAYGPSRRRRAGRPKQRNRTNTRLSTLQSTRAGSRIITRKRKKRYQLWRSIPKKTRRYVAKQINKPTKTNSWRNVESGVISSDTNKCQWGLLAPFLDRIHINAALSMEEHLFVSGANELDVNTCDLAASTDHQWKVHVSNASRKYTIRNNTSLPNELELWWMICINDVAHVATPLVQWGDQLDNKGFSATPETDIRTAWKDGKIGGFGRHWKCQAYKKYTLNPGDEIEPKHTRLSPFMYNYKTDTPVEHLKKTTCYIMYRLQGKLAHDSTTPTQVGITAAQLDWMYQDNIRFAVSSDKSLKYNRILEGTGTLDTPGVGFTTFGADVEEKMFDN